MKQVEELPLANSLKLEAALCLCRPEQSTTQHKAAAGGVDASTFPSSVAGKIHHCPPPD